MAAAGVSWGTFFHYFPAKEDVLLRRGRRRSCRAYAEAARGGPATRGAAPEDVLWDAFAAMVRPPRSP